MVLAVASPVLWDVCWHPVQSHCLRPSLLVEGCGIPVEHKRAALAKTSQIKTTTLSKLHKEQSANPPVPTGLNITEGSLS